MNYYYTNFNVIKVCIKFIIVIILILLFYKRYQFTMKRLIIFILKSIIFICLFMIIYNLIMYYKDSRNYSNIQDLKPISFEDISTNNISTVDISNEYNSLSTNKPLWDINSDYKFWITIPNTNIDYPVVQTSNNDFYLNHNFNKDRSASGCVFIDYRNEFAKDKNYIIYGHNMINDTMFSALTKFKSKEFFNKDISIEIIEDNILSTYNVFSVYTISKNNLNLQRTFKNDNEYLEYINNLYDKSWYHKDINLDMNTNILTLVTCSYEFPNARTIVHAIKNF